jgi:hypothetical protein
MMVFKFAYKFIYICGVLFQVVLSEGQSYSAHLASRLGLFNKKIEIVQQKGKMYPKLLR